MAKRCGICEEEFGGKEIKTADGSCICRRCADAIALLAFDKPMTAETVGFSNNGMDYYRELASDMAFPSGDRIMFDFKTRRIADDKGMFKKKYQVFAFSDIKSIEYKDKRRKGSKQETDKKSAAAGTVVGAAVAAASGSAVKGGFTGARVEALGKAIAGANFMEVVYSYAGKDQKFISDDSLDAEKFSRISECFERVREMMQG